MSTRRNLSSRLLVHTNKRSQFQGRENLEQPHPLQVSFRTFFRPIQITITIDYMQVIVICKGFVLPGWKMAWMCVWIITCHFTQHTELCRGKPRRKNLCSGSRKSKGPWFDGLYKQLYCIGWTWNGTSARSMETCYLLATPIDLCHSLTISPWSAEAHFLFINVVEMPQHQILLSPTCSSDYYCVLWLRSHPSHHVP